MNRKQGWLIALAVAVLLLAACGPQMATPTANVDTGKQTPTAQASSPSATAPQSNPTAASLTAVPPTVVPINVADLPVDASDYRVLGKADAAVTFIEYSDFQ